MIKYSNKLYVSDFIEPKINRIKHNIKLGIGMTGIYVISLSTSENDVFDIFPISLFKQRMFRHSNITVVGFAESEQDCFDIVCEIIKEHYEQFGSYMNLRQDFINYMMD